MLVQWRTKYDATKLAEFAQIALGLLYAGVSRSLGVHIVRAGLSPRPHRAALRSRCTSNRSACGVVLDGQLRSTPHVLQGNLCLYQLHPCTAPDAMLSRRSRCAMDAEYAARLHLYVMSCCPSHKVPRLTRMNQAEVKDDMLDAEE